MTERPVITVVIPAWDVAEMLREAIASVATQPTFTTIVVVNNASEHPLEVDDGVTTVSTGRRLTVGAARNAALPIITTPYVLFLDADDQLLPDTLPRLTRHLERHPETVAIACHWIGFNPRSGARRRWDWPYHYAYRLQHRPRLFAVANACRTIFPMVGATLVRTDAVRAAGGFSDSNRAEDWGLALSLSLRGQLRLDGRPGLLMRLSDVSLTSQHEDFAAIWRSRTEARKRLRHDPAASPLVRVATHGLAVVHLYTALKRVRRRHAAGADTTEADA